MNSVLEDLPRKIQMVFSNDISVFGSIVKKLHLQIIKPFLFFQADVFLEKKFLTYLFR